MVVGVWCMHGVGHARSYAVRNAHKHAAPAAQEHTHRVDGGWGVW
jgi:hypothetical protein